MKHAIFTLLIMAAPAFSQEGMTVIEQHTRLTSQPVPVYTKAANAYFAQQAPFNIPEATEDSGQSGARIVRVNVDMPLADMPKTKRKLKNLCRLVTAEKGPPLARAFADLIESDVTEREQFWKDFAFRGNGVAQQQIQLKAAQLHGFSERSVVDFEAIEQERPEVLRGLLLAACTNPKITGEYL